MWETLNANFSSLGNLHSSSGFFTIKKLVGFCTYMDAWVILDPRYVLVRTANAFQVFLYKIRRGIF